MRRQKTRRYDTIFEGNTYKSWKNSFITQILLNALFCGSFTVAVAASGQSLNRVQNNTRFHFTFIEWFLFWLILPVFNWIFLLYCFYLNFLLLLPDTSHRRHTLTHFDFSPERWRMTLHNEIELCESGRVFFLRVVLLLLFLLVISFVIHIHFFTYFF